MTKAKKIAAKKEEVDMDANKNVQKDNQKFLIEDGVPIPPRRQVKLSWPLLDLREGQSLWAANGNVATARQQVNKARKLVPTSRFVVRAAEIDGVSGVRVWRIA